MLEIEQKFANPDFTDLEARLRALGADGPTRLEEADHYFNAPDRDFKETGEAFRMRRVGSSNWFTYKGPRQPGPVKVRKELEVPLGEGDRTAAEMTELLHCLGYRSVAVVRKVRRQYHVVSEGFDLQVCLDEVEGLGRFAEVEIVAQEGAAERARGVLTALAQGLGLERPEPRAYLTML